MPFLGSNAQPSAPNEDPEQEEADVPQMTSPAAPLRPATQTW